MLERVWREGSHLSVLLKMQIDRTIVENSKSFLKRLNIGLPYDPAILLLGLCFEKTVIQKEACT